MENNKKEVNRFNIDFFEFSFLVEACIPPRPIARSMFWADVINKHYHVLTEGERERLFEWISKNDGFKYSLERGNEDCELFVARFDKDNQYSVTTNYKDKIETHHCFKFKQRFHTSINTSIQEEYITEVKKMNCKNLHND